MRKLFGNKKALSPVVAAIILIAVTVAVSIAVAAWMGSLTFTFMATEQVSYTDCVYGTSDVTLTVRNTGTTTVTIAKVFVNGDDATSASDIGTGVTLDPNTEADIIITQTFNPGSNYAFMVQTMKNNQFGPYTKTAPL